MRQEPKRGIRMQGALRRGLVELRRGLATEWLRVTRRWRKRRDAEKVPARSATTMHRPAPPYYQDLLTIAARFVTEGKDRAGVLVAQMASEVIVEDTLNRLIESRELDYLKAAILGALGGDFNIARKEVSAFYEALTGDDELVTQPFWSRYGHHVSVRDDVAHSGREPTPSEAMESIQVVTDLIRHLERVTG